MNDQFGAFSAHASELRNQYAGLRLSEADTRSYLIDPVLRMLGYVGVEHLRREVPVPATKEHLDYELLIGGEPQAIVEAKALHHPISDQHSAQCVQYASVLGIRWCFITNGAQWHLYDAHAKGPLSQKQVAAVSIDGDERSIAKAWETLALFSKEALERARPLDRLLIERVLTDELASPESATVAALRRAVQARFGTKVNAAAVVAATQGLLHGKEFALLSSEAQEAAQAAAPKSSSRALRPERPTNGMAPPSRITLGALVRGGLIPDGALIEARVSGVSHPARIRNGKIELNGVLYDTPSAASMALRNTQSWNGWVDWQFKGEKLSALRARLGPGAVTAEDQTS